MIQKIVHLQNAAGQDLPIPANTLLQKFHVSLLFCRAVPKKARRGNDRLRSGNVGLHSAGDLAAAQAAGADLTRFTFGFQVRLERRWEWLTLMPKATSLSQNWHFAIA